jgi:hypothetical protein
VVDGAGVIGSHAFCNAAKDGHRSYCRHHAQLAFDKVPKPAVAPKSIGAFGLRFGKAAA